MWIAAQFPVVLVNEPLAKLRIQSESLTSREDLRRTAEGVLSVVDRAFERNPGLAGDCRRRVLAHWYVRFGRGLVLRRRAGEAREAFSRAIEQRPFHARTYLFWMRTWLAGSALRVPSKATAHGVRIKTAFLKTAGPKE